MARVRSVDLGSSFLDGLDGACEILLVRHGEQAITTNMPLADAITTTHLRFARLQDMSQRWHWLLLLLALVVIGESLLGNTYLSPRRAEQG